MPTREHNFSLPHYRVTVIGAGALGASIFACLTKEKTRGNIQLIEQRPSSILAPCSGTAGDRRLMGPSYEDAVHAKLAAESMQWLKEQQATTSVPLFEPTQRALILANESLTKTTQLIKQAKNCGVPFDQVIDSQKNIARIFPYLDVIDNTYAALLYHSDKAGIAYSQAIIDKQLADSEKKGACISFSEEYKEMQLLAGGTLLISTDKRQFRTDQMIFTLGPWGPSRLPTLGEQFKVKRQVFCLYAMRENMQKLFEDMPHILFEDGEVELFIDKPKDKDSLLRITRHNRSSFVSQPPSQSIDDTQEINKLKAIIRKYFKIELPAPKKTISSCCLSSTASRIGTGFMKLGLVEGYADRIIVANVSDGSFYKGIFSLAQYITDYISHGEVPRELKASVEYFPVDLF